METDDKEVQQLEEARTWRSPTPGEITKPDKVVPCVIVRTIKRCGKLKSRLVALGNQMQRGGGDTFAPTISATANRWL